MSFLTGVLEKLPQFCDITSCISEKNTPIAVTGVSSILDSVLTLGAVEKLDKPAVIFVDDENAGSRICDDINTLYGAEIAAFFPAREYTFRAVDGVSRDTMRSRISVLSKLCDGRIKIVIAPIETAATFAISKETLTNNSFTIKEGDTIDSKEFLERLLYLGYARRDFVDGICQFSVRGGIIDLFTPALDAPVRIEMWGDEVDTIATFDAETQRRGERLSSIEILPATEVLTGIDFSGKLQNFAKKIKSEDLKANLNIDIQEYETSGEIQCIDKYIPLVAEKFTTLLDYFTEGMVFICEYHRCYERLKGNLKQLEEDIEILLEEGILGKGLDNYYISRANVVDFINENGGVILDSFARTISNIHLKKLININGITTSPWSGQLEHLTEDIDFHLHNKTQVVVMAGTDKGAKTLLSDLIAGGYSASYFPKDNKLVGDVYVSAGTLSSGFEFPDIGFTLISHSKISKTLIKYKRRVSAKERITSLEDVTRGDLVVHASHGIGVYDGINKLELQGIIKDFIKIKYMGSDVLYVPVTQLDLVTKYIGPKEDGKVKLSKLGGVQWQNAKTRVRKAVEDMAGELIELYAKRQNSPGTAFPEDDDFQRDFDERFAYEETSDQMRSIEEIKADMQKPYPMDRLLCGDVGFGKTEVALRGVFKCIMGGKQCILLVPTTILAWQHYQTMVERFEHFPVNIQLLSRFKKPKEQKKILAGLKDGTVDIVVGTHRLVQKDVKPSKLGLLIIDEEQRFGVAQKEKLKTLFPDVDVLTLSATPIPRTLNMAMSGIRDMSTIEEPPYDRYPVQTYVMEYSKEVVNEAIRRELRRAGQVFYLHNRVETIGEVAGKIQRDFPEHTVAFSHGKMSESELSGIWQKLIDGDIDILVTTSIIETGVDVPNCNTLIVENSDRLGLSQLYQLRGRVGRSSRRAYVYFTFSRGKVLTEIAAKRLSAIREFTKFGSGIKIAMRDLEIRGAGNILGSSQHGHMESVGYEMYLRLLSDAIAEQKGEKSPNASVECMVDIMMDAHIPEDYISSNMARVEIYRKIAAIKTEESRENVIDELIDRFGDIPKSVMGLLDIALLRGTAAGFGIYEIKQSGDKILFYLTGVDLKDISAAAGLLKGRFMLTPTENPYFSVKMLKGESPVETIAQVMLVLRQL